MNKHLMIILQAVLVTFLWSTSYVIVKRGLVSIPPITFAGLRYFIAFLCLLPVLARKRYRNELRSLEKRQWVTLLMLGLIFYAITQGSLFFGLSLLPSTTVGLMLNFIPIVVVALSAAYLNERPTARQISGTVLFIAGAVVFFLPLISLGSRVVGLAVMALSVLSNATSSMVGRNVNRKKNISPFIVTLVSMSFGSTVLLSLGLVTEGIPEISAGAWLSILWLSVVNTAFAFTLWNRTLRYLTAVESSIINGTMLIQIAILAWIFLGEQLTITKILGMALASVGAVLVQLKSRSNSKGNALPDPDARD
jgi:drug/metabolite transporter (DMT)-like permease